MNLLLLSVGRRTKIVEYFQKEFSGTGKIIATDCDEFAPAIYFADKYYIVPKITEEGYIDTILNICKKEDINGVISLIDPELSLISENEEKFTRIGVKLFISEYKTCELCFDKYAMFEFLSENGFNCAKTYTSPDRFLDDLGNGEISFPVFVKPRCGSASLGINKVDNIKHLKLLFELSDDLIIQEFLNGQEYGADCFIDTISGELVSVFIKKKIRMRSGETDKAISFKNEKLFEIISDFVKRLNARGTIDIDIFEVNGKWYISEVNPRFGGGYPQIGRASCRERV